MLFIYNTVLIIGHTSFEFQTRNTCNS